jgi:hypothetical protein
MGTANSSFSDGSAYRPEDSSLRALSSAPAVQQQDTSLGIQDLGLITPARPALELVPLASHAARSPEMERARRLAEICGDHRYVSIELPSKEGIRTVHITKQEDPSTYAIHVVTDGVLPRGQRYTSLESRTFVSNGSPDLAHGFNNQPADVDRLLEEIDCFLANRATRPVVVQGQTQGWHELGSRLVLGLPDTGGQNMYVNEMSRTLAQQGFQVIIVNRGGPPHPTTGDVREGMHYGSDGVDLLYVTDGFEGFVPKEAMYPEFPPDRPADRVLENSGFAMLARDMTHHLRQENVRVVIGHYIDGAATGKFFCDMVEESGRPRPQLWAVVHSIGDLKERNILESGRVVPDSLRMPERKLTERLIFAQCDQVFAVSDPVRESLKTCGIYESPLLPAGVDLARFHPIPPGTSRTDPQFDGVWETLSSFTGGRRTPEDLKQCKIVFEASRTDSTKGKDTVIILL